MKNLRFCVVSNCNNPLEKLPERLSLSSRTSEYAMTHPASANAPISPSFNVMGPHPLTYPQSFSERESEAFRSTKSVQTEVNQSRASTGAKKDSIESLLAAASKTEAAEESPQDLSFAKDAHMEEEPKATSSNDMQTSRPQIIVSSHKMAASAAASSDPAGCQMRVYMSQDYSACRSPGKSVIVRAGSSNVSKFVDFRSVRICSSEQFWK